MENNKEATIAKFASFAVFDFETSNIPMYNNNRTAVTEMCIYGFSAKLLSEELRNCTNGGSFENKVSVPASPRVLHKLTLLFNPAMMVHPDATKITGLDNFMLEEESQFDNNAGDTVLGFLQHLQQPVCLVAHNGWGFDFPILKQRLEKLQKEVPSGMMCVDSLRAFMEIEKKHLELNTTNSMEKEVIQLSDTPKKVESSELTLQDALSENSQFNWRQINESTPRRPTSNSKELKTNSKRKLASDTEENGSQSPPEAKKSAYDEHPPPVHLKSRRSLNFGADASPVRKKYPPRGVYKLSNMFERIFKQPSKNAHHAEADVDMLMRLMLHYGQDFMEYAEQHAMPITAVPRLGSY